MAYYDELYHCDNIIGYTGQLNDFPTVYFLSKELRLAGHITQWHDIFDNIGREEAIKLEDYRFGNEPNPSGRIVLVERFRKDGVGKTHTSRNPLIYVNYTPEGERPAKLRDGVELNRTMAILSSSISMFQEAKFMYSSPQAFKRISDLAYAKKMTYNDVKFAGVNMLTDEQIRNRGRGHQTPAKQKKWGFKWRW